MSTITIYKTSRITPSRNLKVNDLENYLSTLTKVSFSDFQYIRPKLDGTIKVNLGQEDAFSSVYAYDYLKVANGNGERTQYYFITKVEQRSEETLELTLHMDTINTFEGNYTISPNSVIHREFKDRFKKQTVIETTSEPSTNSDIFGFTLDGWGEGICSMSTRLASAFDTIYPNAVLIGCVAHWNEGQTKEAISVEQTDAVFRATFRNFVREGEESLPTPDYLVWTFQYDRADRCIPIIDYLSEGIEPQMYKTSEEQIPQIANQSWNLVYRAENAVDASLFNQVNPLNVYMVPDNPTAIKYSNPTGRVKSVSDFTTNRYTYFSYKTLPYDLQAEILHTGSELKEYAPITNVAVRYDGWIYSDGTSLTYYYGWQDGSHYRIQRSNTNISQITFLNGGDNLSVGILNALPTERPSEDVLTETIPLGEYTSTTSKGVQEIGLDDARLIKVIKLPYPPSTPSFDEDGNIYFNKWDYAFAEGMFKGSIDGKAFTFEYRSSLVSPLAYLGEGFSATVLENKHLPWSKDYEPKLLHSDFHQPKFVYDSFNFLFELEKVDTEEWNALPYKDTLSFDFIVTSTVNSKFMFIFPDYVLNKSQSDYDNVLPIARNNEVTIYSNQYVNYLRTGYNYDVKNKERAKWQAGLGIGQTLIGQDISLLTYNRTQNPLTGLQLPNQFAGTISNIVGNIMSINKAEEAMEQKKRTMLNQATSVSGSDDIDLLVAYSNNQAKMVYYNPSEIMSDALATLFHYCGYVSERRGVPNENTRYWFDFCQADIDFINERSAPAWALDEIKVRYSAGLTILHTHSNEWDIEQQYENWENTLQ